MKLSIAASTYTESEEVLARFLSSVDGQIGINGKRDVEILLVDDSGSARFSIEFLSSFRNLRIEYVVQAHGGISKARNAGLRMAEGDYVLFCDTDDCLFSCISLAQVLLELNSHPEIDIFVFDFLEELPDGRFLNHTGDFLRAHAKVFSKSFLKHKDLKFAEELAINEDSYFVSLARNLTKNIRVVPIPIHVWRYRENSISRSKEFQFQQFHTILDASSRLIEELDQRKLATAPQYVTQMFLHVYFRLQFPEWDSEENQPAKQHLEAKFAKYARKYRHHFDPAIAALQYREERALSFGGTILEKETLSQFLERAGNGSSTEVPCLSI